MAHQMALVTGANGYIGSAVVAAFAQAGIKTRAIARSQAKADAWIERNPKLKDIVEWKVVEGVEKQDAIVAMEGCTVIAHVAADLPQNMLKGAAGVQRTIDGVKSMLQAAKATSTVKRFVLTSSTAALGDPVKILTEDDWNNATLETVEAGKNSPYPASKQLSEQAAWKFVETEKPGFDLVTILPSAVVGPSETQALPDKGYTKGSWAILHGAVTSPAFNFKSPLFSSRKRAYVDVRDVALAHLRAATESSASGKRFILAAPGEYSSYTVIRELRKAFPDHADSMPTPPDGDGEEAAGRADGSRVTKELGVQYRDVIQTFKDMTAELFRRIEESK